VCSKVLADFDGGAFNKVSFFSAAAFSRILDRILFDLLSPKAELDGIFFSVETTAYFEWDDGSVDEPTVAAFGCTNCIKNASELGDVTENGNNIDNMALTFCLISANLALRASVAAECAIFFSNKIAEPGPPAFADLNDVPPGVFSAREDGTFVMLLDCSCVPLEKGSEATVGLLIELVEESEIFVGIAAEDDGFSMTDGLYLDGFNADLGACCFTYPFVGFDTSFVIASLSAGASMTLLFAVLVFVFTGSPITTLLFAVVSYAFSITISISLTFFLLTPSFSE
jgi:hypothetical protein